MSEPRPTAVVVEDEPAIRRFLRISLESEGCSVYGADTLRQGLVEAGTRKPDIIVLDLGLPDGDGVEFLRDLRAWSDVPVIVLSARTAEAQKVEALDCGADDFLVKPFGTAELLARVRALLRRRAQPPGSNQGVLEFDGLRVDFARHAVERGGVPLHLTPIEFRLLSCLAASPGSVLTHRQLLRSVWGPAYADQSHYVRVHMANLRRKLEDDPSQPRHILTEIGVGYRFVA